MLVAIDRGFPQTEITNAAYSYQQRVDKEETIVVGVNKYVSDEDSRVELLKIDEKVEAEQVKRLREVKRVRDNKKVTRTLND
ncbi:MAG: methylmalonyl-CoA mutase family protein, partial [Candidatus Micrarchaeota archaeon]